jgi:hypothetical protein
VKSQVKRYDKVKEPYRLGEAEGLRISLAAARDKLAQLDERTRRANVVNLGIPAFRDIVGRTATLPGECP